MDSLRDDETHFNLAQTTWTCRRLRIKQQAHAAGPLPARPEVESAWAASMGEDLTSCFGKLAPHALRQENFNGEV